MKKFISVFLSLCAVLAFSACGSENTADETTSAEASQTEAQYASVQQETEQASAEASAKAAEEKTDKAETKAESKEWVKAYTDFLNDSAALKKEVPEVEDISGCRFALIYIDSDSVPELVISQGEETIDSCNVFTFSGGSIANLGPFGSSGSFTYVEKSGIIIDSLGVSGHKSEAIYKLDNGKITLVFDGETEADGSDTVYFKDGAEVSAKEYSAARSKAVPSDAKQSSVSYKKCHKLAKSEIGKYIK